MLLRTKALMAVILTVLLLPAGCAVPAPAPVDGENVEQAVGPSDRP